MTKKKKYRKNNHIWYPCRFTIREPYSNHKYLNHKHKKKKKSIKQFESYFIQHHMQNTVHHPRQ